MDSEWTQVTCLCFHCLQQKEPEEFFTHNMRCSLNKIPFCVRAARPCASHSPKCHCLGGVSYTITQIPTKPWMTAWTTLTDHCWGPNPTNTQTPYTNCPEGTQLCPRSVLRASKDRDQDLTLCLGFQMHFPGVTRKCSRYSQWLHTSVTQRWDPWLTGAKHLLPWLLQSIPNDTV